MTKAAVLVIFAALALALGGCAAAPHSVRPVGKVLRMINNTAGTVIMQSCPAGAPQRCSAVARIAPGNSADFALSSVTPGSPPRLVHITGYGKLPVCFIVPTARRLRSTATAYVTDAQSDDCIDLYREP